MNKSLERNLRGLGNRLLYLRDNAGMSQDGVAAAIVRRYGLSCTQGHVSKVERGQAGSLLSVPMLLAFAELFDVSTDYLLGRTEEPAAIIDEGTTGYLTAEAEIIARIVDNLSVQRRADLLAIAQALETVKQPETISPTEFEIQMHSDLVDSLQNALGPAAVQAYSEKLQQLEPVLWEILFGRDGLLGRMAQ